MIHRWKPGLSRLGTVACASLFFLSLISLASEAQAAKIEAYMVLKWEGRAFEEPNLEALDKFRKTFPEIPVIHLVNPSYFKESPKVSEANFHTIQKRVTDNDEVGLYVVPSANIVKAADVLPLKKPTFWSYSDEICTADCGMAVPVTAYSRPDLVKLVYTAHTVLKEFGFMNMESYAVHGFVAPAGLPSIAEGLGYKFDLSAVDKELVRTSLKEYPIGQWVESAENAKKMGEVTSFVQVGGVVEFNNDEEILKRFENFSKSERQPSQAFILSISQENLFMSQSRLTKAIEGMKAHASQRGDEVVFEVMNKGKKGRPIAIQKGISEKL